MGLATVADILASASGQGGAHMDVLHGTVTTREAMDRLSQRHYSVLHWASHGTDGSLRLSDGMLTGEMIREAVAKSKSLKLAVLNACQSIRTGIDLYTAGVDYVICWRGDVGDKAAVAFATTFWTHWKLSHDPREAFGTACAMLTRFYPEQELPLILNGRQQRASEETEQLRGQLASRAPFSVKMGQVLLAVLLVLLLILLALSVHAVVVASR